MDQETHENKAVVGSLSQVNQGTSGDSSNSGVGVVLQNPVVLNSGEEIASGESTDFDAKVDGLRSTKRVIDQEANDGRGVDKSLDEGTSGNSSNLVNEVILERMIVINSGEIVSICGENRDLGIKIDESGLVGRLTDREECIERGNEEALGKVEQDIRRDSCNSINGVVLETVILVHSEENAAVSGGNEQLEIKGSELEPSKVMVDKSKTKVSKGEKQSYVIDMKCGGGGGGSLKDRDGERVCRICHLGSEGLVETTATTPSTDLIQLGCGCKDELGIAHAYCAEAWFKLKGNRMCEICGETAKNITGVGDNRFMEEWNQRRFIGSSSSSSDRGGGCWRGQPFCNFLMACLVIAFVLPWFFRINMF